MQILAFHLFEPFKNFLVCQATEVGNNNVFGIKARVGSGAKISNGCVIGAKCENYMIDELPPLTVIHGERNTRRSASEKPPVSILNKN